MRLGIRAHNFISKISTQAINIKLANAFSNLFSSDSIQTKMSPLGNPNTEHVEQVSEALQNASLQSPPHVGQTADAVLEPTSTPDPMKTISFPDEGWSKDWYDGDDFTNPHQIEESVCADVLKWDHELKEKGAQFSSFAVEGDYGEVQIRAQQFPGPGNLVTDRTKVYIRLERRKPWYPKDRPKRAPHDKDIRPLEMINDVFTSSAPYKDTNKIFPNEIKLSRGGDKMAWTEGQMLGEADEETKAPVSSSEEFLSPGDHSDTRSSTSRGHVVRHRAPYGTGAGWGDYDRFYEWQANGRAIKKEWVKQGDPNWRHNMTKPIVIVDDEGKKEVIPYSASQVNYIEDTAKDYKTLHEKICPRSTRPAHQNAPSRRGRGTNANFRGGWAGSRSNEQRGGQRATSDW
ncbi:hypothetical protein FNAPI_12343 [Fusarium napiforme]|uniref:Uncharacterized protein n=1 Tax=Fusarium napiforme TaxID=42672 RepID=A0A8H5IEG1_9HYPO|nr:hypothetical protein FNAPI_12343 [Fusarium napiforme]